MKICFAIKTMSHAHGGAERVLAHVASGLAQAGHDVTLLTFDQENQPALYPLDENIKRVFIPIGDAARPSNFRETFLRIRALRAFMRAQKPDVFIAFMHSAFIPAAFAGIGLGVPVIGAEHIVPAHYQSRRGEFILFLCASFFLAKITVLSDRVRSLYPKFLQRKMIVMPNPIAGAKNAVAPQSKTRRLILNVGRLDPQKDQASLIEAFALLAPAYPDWDLKIIGEGHLRGALEDLIAEKNLQSRVTLPGTTSAIHAEYETVDIFAMSSLYESFGLATAEAMSFGLPVIGFADCPGTNELIVHEHNGLLVSGQNRAQALAEGLKILMDDPEMRRSYGLNGRQSVQKYGLHNVIKNWEALLKEVRRP